MRRLVALLLIIGVAACSKVVPPAPAELCADPGVWAVVVQPRPSGVSGPPAPLTGGSAAAAGAKAGALGSLRTGSFLAGEMLSEDSHSSGLAAGFNVLLAGVFLAAGIVIAPVAAIVGAGIGAGAGHSQPEVAAAQANMSAALEAAQPGDAVRSRILALAGSRAGRRVYDCGGLHSVEACLEGATEPIAMVLVVTVSAPYFEAEGPISPSLRLLLSAEARVTRNSDATLLYRRAWLYRGHQRDYFALAADDAAVFRRDLEMATDALAAKVVDDLMVGGREEVHPSAGQPEGTVWTVFPPGQSGGAANCL